MRQQSLNLGELFAALVIVGLGIFMVWEASGYPFGDLRRMGPGFFPIFLGILLVGLGAATAVEVSRLETETLPPAIRPFFMIMGGIVAFASILPRWGLLPATVSLVLLSAAGDRPFRPLAALGTAVVLSLGGYILFVRAFGLPLTMLRW